MKVLLVYQRYFPKKPTISYFDSTLRKSFECAFRDDDNYTYETLFFGDKDDLVQDSKTLNEEILKRNFDICVVSEELKYYVSIDTAKKLGKKLFLCIWDIWVAIAPNDEINFRIALKRPRIWGEHYSPHTILELSQYCNFLISGYGYEEIRPNIYGFVLPVDTDLYYPKENVEKTIEISHSGNLYIAERQKFYHLFQKNNINVNFYGHAFDRSNYLSQEEYCDVFRKSKISLCFTQSIFGPYHKERKGRIYEIAGCGGFMLMTNPEVFKYKKYLLFEEGVHYDSFNENNYIDKINYYLKNDALRDKMSKEFYKRYMELGSPKVFWENIFRWSKTTS